MPKKKTEVKNEEVTEKQDDISEKPVEKEVPKKSGTKRAY